MQTRVEITYTPDKGLIELKVNGAQMDIELIRNKEIVDWFRETDGRDGWRGLINEIYEFVADREAELAFSFYGPSEYRAVFNNCLEKIGINHQVDETFWQEFAEEHFKEAQRAEYCGNDKEAFRNYLRAGEHGHIEARFRAAEYLWKGCGCKSDADKKEDLLKAMKLYEQSAEQGYVLSMLRLGKCFYEGEIGKKDVSQAVRWFHKAAKCGCAEAQNYLGDCYKNGEGVERDLEKAVRWYRKAADLGNSEAQNNLAECYLNGYGIEKNVNQAIDLFKQSADQGNSVARNNLGKFYKHRDNAQTEKKLDVQTFHKAVDQGRAAVQKILDSGYTLSQSMKQSFQDIIEKSKKDDANTAKQAITWFRKAAEQGNLNAKNDLGECYLYGYGIEKDARQAVLLFKEAAQQGVLKAKNNLGLCYLHGYGVGRRIEGDVNSRLFFQPLSN